MRIGVTGHQEREGIDWKWVRNQIDQVVREMPTPVVGYTSLAAGADQIFARSVLEGGGKVVAVIPMPGYEACFEEAALTSYRELLKRSEEKLLPGVPGDLQESFFLAGLYVAGHSDRVLAIWDQKEAKGRGGTADIVRHCQRLKIPLTVINPINRVITPTA